MYELDKTILQVDDRNDERIDTMFCKHVGFIKGQIPPKMQKKVDRTRQVAMDRFTVTVMYQTERIADRTDHTVTTESGGVFEGKLIARVLEDADTFVLLAATLHGMDEIMEEYPSVTDQMYFDGWATAILESAVVDLRLRLKEEIKQAGFYPTATWSPGQNGFEIRSQEPLFQVLHPEEIGISLNDSFLMIPQKSVSQLFGISRKDQSGSPVPCDYCPKQPTCPDAYSETADYH